MYLMTKSLVSQISVKFIFNQLKLLTVESCTGGWIGKAITDIPGNSSWYEGGFITYSNRAKRNFVSVPDNLLEQYGAVSIEVAEAMAIGANQYFPDNIVVSVTGIAGPDGGSEEKPVGTVCIACHYFGKIKSRKFEFSGNRDAIREQTVIEALNLLLAIDFKKNS